MQIFYDLYARFAFLHAFASTLRVAFCMHALRFCMQTPVRSEHECACCMCAVPDSVLTRYECTAHVLEFPLRKFNPTLQTPNLRLHLEPDWREIAGILVHRRTVSGRGSLTRDNRLWRHTVCRAVPLVRALTERVTSLTRGENQ